MKRKLLLSLIAVLGLSGLMLAQNKPISGIVTGADGAPIAGATVVVEGTSIGTTTDAAGHYTIAAPSDGQLNVSFIGYQEQTIAIAGKTSVDVVLEESHTSIDDVIIVAYGQTTKEAFTGSASVVRADDIAQRQTTNVVDALTGKVAGVQIMNSTGQPGTASPTVLIRGISSINAGKEPLYIVDGMAFAGSISDINPSDIESMSVLKDAAATALYGARGANGVILINTKRAKSNDAVVNLDIRVGVNQRAQQDYDYITSPAEYYETYYKALKNYYVSNGQSASAAHANANALLTSSSQGGLAYNVYTVPMGQTLIGANGKLNPNATLGRMVEVNGQQYWMQPDDWTKEVYQNGLRQEYNVNVSAANEKTNFFGSFGYLNNDGIVAKTGYERYSARLRADYQAKKWLKIGGNAAYMRGVSQIAMSDGSSNLSGNIFLYTRQIAPIYPLYIRDANGNIMHDEYGNTMYDYGGVQSGEGSNFGVDRPVWSNTNGYADHLLNKYNYTNNTMSFNGFVDITFLKNFKLTINGGVSAQQYDTLVTQNPLYGSARSSGGYIYRESGLYWSYTLQQMLSYSNTFAEKHSIDILVGHENNYDSSRYLYGDKTGLFSINSTELPQALNTSDMSSTLSEYSNEGYFLRAQYDYDQRIFVSGSYRRDASSKFHPDHRWGNFWSASAAWLINRESWFNSSAVDELKLKVSYGSQGNDGITSFLYMDRYSITNDGTGKWSVSFSQKGNPNITWETNSNLNAGVEFAFFGYRLSGSLEYFNRMTTNMLSQFSVPSSLGYSYYWKNVGDMRNSGFELELNSTLIQKKNFSWDVNLNMTYLKNKITKLDPESKTESFRTLSGDVYYGYRDGWDFYGEGLPIYNKLLKAYAGVNEQGQALYYAYETDENGVKNYDSLTTTTNPNNADYFVFNTALPDVYGGFGTSFRLYGFDLSVNFAYQIGGKIIDYEYAASMSSPVADGITSPPRFHKDIHNAWSTENPDSNIPRLQLGDQYTAYTSSRFLTDASYLSLQSINFGYTIPRKWTSKISIEKLRLYVACDNVWLWSARKGLDPRTTYTGDSTGAVYSPIRTISGGINITF